MIHYHGTPCGGTRQGTVEFLSGRHALIPFPRPEDLPVAAEVCQSFCFDNGAFSVWKRGGTLDVEGYTRWADLWHRHPAFDWALIPDVIDGTEADNDAMLRDWPDDVEGVPVWHLHESLDRLCRLADGYRTVALGSSGRWATPGAPDWWERMSEAMDAACDDDGRPNCRLHGLRMLDPAIFTRLPFASADSTNAARNSHASARYGMYCPPSSGMRMAVIASRIEAHQSAPVWRRRERQGVLTGMFDEEGES